MRSCEVRVSNHRCFIGFAEIAQYFAGAVQQARFDGNVISRRIRDFDRNGAMGHWRSIAKASRKTRIQSLRTWITSGVFTPSTISVSLAGVTVFALMSEPSTVR